MFQTYEEIFAQRADSYHAAMEAYPHARLSEFERALALAAPQAGDTVCDVPAGGGYLRRYMPRPDIGYVGVETSEYFAAHCHRQPGDRIILSDLEDLALASGTVDICISLAGVHHLPDKPAFFREVRRVLTPGGRFVLADVESGTAADRFLNGFIDETNSMGHEGDFLSPRTRADLRGTGFTILSDRLETYTWNFDTAAAMGDFCGKLFGVDTVGPDAVIDGIGDTLGYAAENGTVRMTWALSFILAEKPAGN